MTIEKNQKKKISRREIIKLAPLAAMAYTYATRLQPKRVYQNRGTPPNILVLVFDTLSARHMSLHGYPRQTTPQIEAASRLGQVFNRHYSAGNFTTPGTASMLTGMYPWKHRAINNSGTVVEKQRQNNIFRLLKEKYQSFSYTQNPLAQKLLGQFSDSIDDFYLPGDVSEASFYLTDRFHANDSLALDTALDLVNGPGTTVKTSSIFSNAQRFYQQLRTRQVTDYAVYPNGLPRWPRRYIFSLEKTVDWLLNRVKSAQNPFFGYVHLLPPHGPYVTRKEYFGLFETDNYSPVEKPESDFSMGLSAEALHADRVMYDESIAFVDAEFGRFFHALKDSGQLENTVLFLTSDHGELFERGIVNHVTPVLYDGLVNVPLLMWGPEVEAGAQIDHPTSAVDMLPTLAKIAGQELPYWAEGEMLPEATIPDYDRPVFAFEGKENFAMSGIEIGTLMMIRDQFKLIEYWGREPATQNYELYNLAMDREELSDLSDSSEFANSVVFNAMQEIRTRIAQVP